MNWVRCHIWLDGHIRLDIGNPTKANPIIKKKTVLPAKSSMEWNFDSQSYPSTKRVFDSRALPDSVPTGLPTYILCLLKVQKQENWHNLYLLYYILFQNVGEYLALSIFKTKII